MNVKDIYRGLEESSLGKDTLDRASQVLRNNEEMLQGLLDDFQFKHPDEHEDWTSEIGVRIGMLINPILEEAGLPKENRRAVYDLAVKYI